MKKEENCHSERSEESGFLIPSRGAPLLLARMCRGISYGFICVYLCSSVVNILALGFLTMFLASCSEDKTTYLHEFAKMGKLGQVRELLAAGGGHQREGRLPPHRPALGGQPRIWANSASPHREGGQCERQGPRSVHASASGDSTGAERRRGTAHTTRCGTERERTILRQDASALRVPVRTGIDGGIAHRKRRGHQRPR